jgi:hypothetical protein
METSVSENQLRDVARWVRTGEQFGKYYRLKNLEDNALKRMVEMKKEEEGGKE